MGTWIGSEGTVDDSAPLSFPGFYDQRLARTVRQVALDHIAVLKRKIAEMEAMADTLATLVSCCAGDDRPDCPILADLTGGSSPVEPKSAHVRGR